MIAEQQPDTVAAALARPLGRWVVAGVIAALVFQAPPSRGWALPVIFMVTDWLIMRWWGRDTSVRRRLVLRFIGVPGAMMLFGMTVSTIMGYSPVNYPRCAPYARCTYLIENHAS